MKLDEVVFFMIFIGPSRSSGWLSALVIPEMTMFHYSVELIFLKSGTYGLVIVSYYYVALIELLSYLFLGGEYVW